MKDLVETFLYNRHPLKVGVRFEGVPLPHVRVEIKNQTPQYMVHIHSVRVHHGTRKENMALVLFPFDKVSIPPKDKREWSLEYEPSKTKVRRNSVMDAFPPYFASDHGPDIDSPASLFDAIGRGDPKDSWIEIDFNEYDNRVFAKGRVSEIFDAVGKAVQEWRKRKMTNQAPSRRVDHL